MKRNIVIRVLALSCAMLAADVALHAAGEDEILGARITAEVDYRVTRGLHLFATEELRLGGRDIMDRFYTEAGVSYKITDFLKASLSYTAIGVYKSETTETPEAIYIRRWYEWRHRVTGDLTASFKVGQWKFSIRERVQGTYRDAEINNYQRPQTSWVLRSRFKASYGFRSVPLEPYAYVEPRIMLNGARWSAEGAGYESAEFLGHDDVYFNRLRGVVGVGWRLDARNVLDFYILYEHELEKDIDARKEGSDKGVGLKVPVVMISSDKVALGVGYKYSF